MPNRSIPGGNIYVTLLLRLLVVLLFFVLTRIAFFAFNHYLFKDVGLPELLMLLFYGLRFDIPSVIYLNSLYILLVLLPFKFRNLRLYRIISGIAFYIPNIIGLAANIIDIAYFRFTGRRSTGDVISILFSMEDNIKELTPNFISDYPQLFIVWIVLVLIFVIIISRIRYKSNSGFTGIRYFLVHLAGFILCVGIAVIGARGGLQLKPIGIITAGKYAQGKNIHLLLNTPFTIISTLNDKGLSKVNYYNDEKALEQIFSPLHHGTGEKVFHPYNVVIIILESFSREHIGIMNHHPPDTSNISFTPFLDSLIGQSYTCYNAYANGTRSIEAIPAIISGFPTLMEKDLISSPYAGDHINSLVSLLKPYGYYSAFFHGGNNGTMNFDSYARQASFDDYYGRNEYNNDADYDGKWGIFDEEFLQYAARKMHQMKQPFISAIFTLSSHHPYTIPKKYKGKFLKGRHPIKECIMYSDYALRKFFESIYKDEWFENTIFVITADHVSEVCDPVYNTIAGRYAIPVIFYSPALKIKGKEERPVQQIDILPSLFSLMNFPESFISFGQSIFDPGAKRFAICYYNKVYQVISGNYLFQFMNGQSLALYNLAMDPFFNQNIMNDSVEITKQFHTITTAIIQQYNNRLINNNLVP